MKKEIRLIDAINRWGKGKDTLVLVPSKDNEGNLLFVPSSFMKHMEKLGNSMFLIDDEDTSEESPDDTLERTKQNIDQIDKNMQPKNEQEEPKVDTPISSNAKQAKIDIGKLVALNNAGWSVANIAGELRVSKATVYKYLREIRDGKILPKGFIDGYDEPEE